MPFSALKRLGTSLLSRPTTPSASTPSTPPISSTPPPPAAVTEQTLFPVVTKEEDGEDCDHDCDACPGYGRAFEKIGVDTDDKMFGNVKGYATHVIVATGETDWIRDVEDIKGSFMKAVAKKIDMVENGVGYTSSSSGTNFTC